MQKILFAPILLALILNGCISFKGKPRVNVDVQRDIQLKLENPVPVELDNPEWRIVTPENANEKFSELEKKMIDKSMFCLTDSGYESIAKNMEQIQTHILELHNALDAYKEFYESK